jgi:hypothetical protein
MTFFRYKILATLPLALLLTACAQVQPERISIHKNAFSAPPFI